MDQSLDLGYKKDMDRLLKISIWETDQLLSFESWLLQGFWCFSLISRVLKGFVNIQIYYLGENKLLFNICDYSLRWQNPFNMRSAGQTITGHQPDINLMSAWHHIYFIYLNIEMTSGWCHTDIMHKFFEIVTFS